MFNGACSIALFMLYSELAKIGLGLRLSRCEGTFWNANPHDGALTSRVEHVIDAVFVDDECLVLLASTPTRLNSAIRALVQVVVQTFVALALALEINWKPGKSERMVGHRGKQSSNHYASLKCGDQRCLEFPGLGISLHVVDEYKHVGCVSTPDGRLKRDADHNIFSRP
eukprot:9286222-Pyramimonas_sp.AAC.1